MTVVDLYCVMDSLAKVSITNISLSSTHDYTGQAIGIPFELLGRRVYKVEFHDDIVCVTCE